MSSLEQLAKAIERGDSSIAESLISSGSVDVNARLPLRFQPPALVVAAERGRKAIVDVLLRANARVNDCDEAGQTACHGAAKGAHHAVLALLLARQANLAVTDGIGKAAFYYAVIKTHFFGPRCALMLLEAGASLEGTEPSDLCRFAAGSTATIQALLDRGVVVRELRDSGDGTPLHVAARRCRESDVFDMLVNVCGLDLEKRDHDGETCFHTAASHGNVFALRWLLDAGADPDCVAANGSTPLHNVTLHNAAVILLAAGADVSARDNKGRTALQRVPLRGARLRNELPAVYPLLAAGADLDIADDSGSTFRKQLAHCRQTIDPAKVEAARRNIAKTRLNFVRHRALQVCIGLQSRELDALQMCEIVRFACGRFAPLIPFHIWWKIATAVKHFQRN